MLQEKKQSNVEIFKHEYLQQPNSKYDDDDDDMNFTTLYSSYQ